MLETIVKTGMDILAPKKAKTIHSNEPPRINSKLKQLIAKRQRALAEGDLDQYRDLRNRVNRERKLCRARFYESTVEQLKESKPATWWREVKKLSGMSSSSGCPDPATLYQHIDCGQSTPPTLQDIAITINKAFLAPMNVLEPLAADSFPRPITEECPLKVSELSVFKDGAYCCYCAYVLRISRYSDFLSPMLTNKGIFLRGLKLSGESRPQ